MTKAERLIETLLTNPESADNGILANDLLGEFHRGFSIVALRPLLSSRNDKVLRVAAFVASELGNNATPLLDLMVKLLNAPDKFVRCDAICAVLTCAGGNNHSGKGKGVRNRYYNLCDLIDSCAFNESFSAQSPSKEV